MQVKSHHMCWTWAQRSWVKQTHKHLCWVQTSMTTQALHGVYTHCLINFWAVGTAGCMLERVHCLRRSGLVPSTKQTKTLCLILSREFEWIGPWSVLRVCFMKVTSQDSEVIESKILGPVSFGSERWHSSKLVCLYIFIILMLWIK